MADIEEGTPEETSEASEGSRVPPSKHQVNPEPPEDVPQELKAPATAKGDWVGTTGSLNTSDFDATNLCLPSKSGTFWAFLLASAFTFLALLAYGFAERTFFSVFWRQLLRLIGWELMVYVPVMCLVQPILRNYLFYNLQPSQSLADAWPLCEGVNASTQWFRKLLVPCLQHLLVTAIMATLTFLEFNQKYLGMLAFSCSASPLVLLLVVLLLRVLGPPVTAKSYAFSLLPFVGAFPLIFALVLMSAYMELRQFGGVWIGLLMPGLLSFYEQFGTWLVTRRFIQKFMLDMDARQSYSTNQGVVVSLAICNLHAISEGARFTLLYADNQNHGPAWVPIVSGVVWNVLSRVGCLDCFLHFVSRRRWKPNNSSKLLRESGYCMGYLRFGAVFALILSRMCLGTPFSWDAPEVALVAAVFLAEVVEDMISYALWRLGVNVSPENHFATDQEVEVKVQRRLSRRHSQGSFSPVAPEPSVKASSNEISQTERWKVRVEHDFKFGPKEFGRLPLWAHFMPAAAAQFLTILSLIVVSGGVAFFLGMCDGRTGQTGILWWNDELCH